MQCCTSRKLFIAMSTSITSNPNSDNRHNLSRWHGHITLNFKTEYMPHNPQDAKQTILEFINSFGVIVGQDLIALWSLVQTLPYVYHVHILVSKMPKKYAKSNLAERGYVYDIKAMQSLLLEYGCYLDNRHNPHIRNQKKIIAIDNIEHSRNAENYILMQPRLDDFGHEQTVILHGNISYSANSDKDNSLEKDLQSQLELDRIHAQSKNEEITQKQCSSCHAVYPHTIDYFVWHTKGKYYRGQCRICTKLFHAKRDFNLRALRFEELHGLSIGSLGRLSNADMLELKRSQTDKSGVVWDCHVDNVLDFKQASIDHIVTFAHGGDNRLSNLGITTRSINSKKSSKKLIDFARSQAAIGIRIKNVDIVVQQKMELD